MDAMILCGSDDGCRIWVNGEVVHTNNRARAMKVDEDKVNVKLEEGWNRVLFKVRQQGGGAGMAFRITDRGRQPIRGMEYHPFGDVPIDD